MNQLYLNIGISKQAVWQYKVRQEEFDQQVIGLMAEVEDVRRDHPGCGLEKMYYTLTPSFMGRDRFIETFTELGFRLKKKMNYKRTTYSSPSNFPNLIKGMVVNAACIIWQTDITYFAVGDKFYYGVFIIDVYTKIIVGYQVSDNMRATANIKAIQMAFKDYKPPKIHHSDRGSQYTCKEYLSILRQHSCKISMAQSAQDNAYAERINNTIKNEYLIYWKQKSFEQLKLQVDKAVFNYNNKRLHNNLDKQITKVFNQKIMENKLSKNKKMTIFNNQN
jgi:putative transposase